MVREINGIAKRTGVKNSLICSGKTKEVFPNNPSFYK